MLEILSNVLMESSIFSSSKKMYRAYVDTVMRQSELGSSYKPGRHDPHAEKMVPCANPVYGAYAYTHDTADGGTWVAEIIAPAPPGLLVIAQRKEKSFFWNNGLLEHMASLVARFKDALGVEQMMDDRRCGTAGE